MQIKVLRENAQTFAHAKVSTNKVARIFYPSHVYKVELIVWDKQTLNRQLFSSFTKCTLLHCLRINLSRCGIILRCFSNTRGDARKWYTHSFHKEYFHKNIETQLCCEAFSKIAKKANSSSKAWTEGRILAMNLGGEGIEGKLNIFLNGFF